MPTRRFSTISNYHVRKVRAKVIPKVKDHCSLDIQRALIRGTARADRTRVNCTSNKDTCTQFKDRCKDNGCRRHLDRGRRKVKWLVKVKCRGTIKCQGMVKCRVKDRYKVRGFKVSFKRPLQQGNRPVKGNIVASCPVKDRRSKARCRQDSCTKGNRRPVRGLRRAVLGRCQGSYLKDKQYWANGHSRRVQGNSHQGWVEPLPVKAQDQVLLGRKANNKLLVHKRRTASKFFNSQWEVRISVT